MRSRFTGLCHPEACLSTMVLLVLMVVHTPDDTDVCWSMPSAEQPANTKGFQRASSVVQALQHCTHATRLDRAVIWVYGG